MSTVVLIVVGLVILAVAAFLALRSRQTPDALPLDTDAGARRIEPKAAEAPAARPAATKPDPVASPVAHAAKPPTPPVSAETASPSSVEIDMSAALVDAPIAKPVVRSVPPPAAPDSTKLSGRPPAMVEQATTAPKKDLSALKRGLQSTRGGWVSKLVGLFGGKKEIDPALLEGIQETLLMGDVGPKTTERLTASLDERLRRADVSDENVVWGALRDAAREIIDVKAPAFGSRAGSKTPLVILVVGVNGVGKTTTIGKLASRYKERGKKVYLAAGDTFRAAAVAQLEAWGKRVGVPVVKGKDLTKPSAVVFDAVQTAVEAGADIIIADTAGRLHTKTPLMDELRKLRDAAGKALPGAPHEILLVLDATTGQNGIVQVKEFRDALELTGIVLTKIDGTAKGGVILGICDEFKLPVRFVGVGEKVDDLREFDADDFTAALFTRPGDDDVAAA